jgi:rubrerythrin
MTEDNALVILKQAILLEKKGKAFYETAADRTENTAVKNFFNSMAQEEVEHIRILSDQYKAYQENKTFLADQPGSEKISEVAAGVLSSELRNKISAADFEAAAISAAMAMEERAIKLYASRAEVAESPEEKRLYQWLSDWETHHLDVLGELDRTLTEQVWNDNSFWPF